MNHRLFRTLCNAAICFTALLPCTFWIRAAQSAPPDPASQQPVLSAAEPGFFDAGFAANLMYRIPFAPQLSSSRLRPAGGPPAPVNTTWTGGAGNFSNAAMWTSGVPNGNFNAFIDGGNPVASAVTLDISAGLNNLTISAGDSLSISNSLALTVNGATLSNKGQLLMNSAGNGTELIVGGSSLTLSGTGTVTLSNSSQNFIYGTVGTNALINQSTIQGAGTIGDNQLTLTNSGTINANASTQLIVNPSGGTANTGTLEATAGGTLNLQNSVSNSGGTVLASGANSVVNLTGATIMGGTLATTNGGLIQSIGSTLSGLTNTGTLSVSNGNSATILGTITNTGSIQLNSSGNGTELIVGAGTATLTGAGTVTLSNSSQNYIYGAVGTETLVNQSTIQGAGTIGDNQLTLTNSGTIDANASTQLIVNPSGGTANTGTLEATAGGTLNLQNSVSNSGGTVLASGANSVVNLTGATIMGGTLATTNGGLIQSIGSTLSGLTNTGTLSVSNGNSATILGTITNTGSIQLNSSGNGTELIVGAGTATLTGAGTVTLSNSSQNYIYGAVGTETLVNRSTIQGAGTIGDNQLTLINAGAIDANVSTQLIVNPSGGTTNTGTLEATAGGALNLQNTVTNTGAVIQASGTGSIVTINGASVTGGTLNTSNGGVISSNNATLSGLTNAGLLQIPNSLALNLLGTINNTGSIQINSGDNGTNLNSSGTVTLTGGGTVVLSDNSQNYVTGAAGSLLINQDNTIAGSGDIGQNTMAFTNHGIVDAMSANGNQLLIQTGTAGTTNTGTLEASSGGTLQIQNTAVNNAGGIIQALAGTGTLAGGTVTLNGSSITGGTVQGSGTGVNTGVIVSTGATLTNLTTTGTIQTPNGQALTLSGTITNTGTIQLNSVANGTDLVASGTVNLTGGGTVVLSDNTQNYLEGAAGSKLVNVNNTISGAGDIGNGTMAFTNEGIVDATSANKNHLKINTGTAAGVNLATMEASSGGILEIDSAITNQTSTATGTIQALNGGSVVLEGATISGGNLMSTGTGGITATGATLNGSTYAVNVAGRLTTPNGYSLGLKGTINDNGTITLDSSHDGTTLKIDGPTVTLQGTGKLVLSDNTQNYIKGASTGTEQLINKVLIEGAGDIGDGFLTLTNDGTIDATSTTGHNLIIDPGTGGVTNAGTMAAIDGATLELQNSINNAAGTISAASGSTVLMDGSLVLTGGNLTGAGTFVSVGATLMNLSNASTVQIPNGQSLTLSGTITNTGSIQSNSGGNGTFLNASGAVTLTGGGTVVLSDNSQNYVSGTSGSSLTNANNTISGSGNIGNNTVAFINQGTVDATSANGSHLLIQAGGAGATNTSVMEASSGGTLELQNTVNNTGGNITALAGTGTSAGGTVLLSGATVTGGTLNSLGTGVNAGTIVSNGGTLVSLTNAGTINVGNGGVTTLQGTITNNGTIALNSIGNGTYLLLSGNVTLNGTGTVALSNNSQNYIEGSSIGTEVLTNDITIEGSGNLGNGQMGLVNNGTILANESTPLYIDASAGFTNKGTLQTAAGSLLAITGPFSNFSGTTLTGGKYVIAGTLQFTGADIVTNAANITLSGTSSAIVDQSGNNALALFTTNASAGKFTLSGNQNLLTSGGSFTNAGSVLVNTGSTFTIGNAGVATVATNYTQTSGVTTVNGVLTSSPSSAATPTVTVQSGSLFGDGTVADPLASSGIVTPGDSSTATGKLDVTGSYTQTAKGSFDASIGGLAAGTKYDQLDVTGAARLSGTLNIKSIGGFIPTIGATFDILNAGSLSGTFSTVTGTAINSTEHYAVSYTGTEVVLTVVSGAATGFPTSAPALMPVTSIGKSSDHLAFQKHGSSSIGLTIAAPHPAPSFGLANLAKPAVTSGSMASLGNINTPRYTPTAFSASALHPSLAMGKNPARNIVNYHLDLGTMLQVGRSRGFAAAVKELTTHYSNLGYLEYR